VALDPKFIEGAWRNVDGAVRTLRNAQKNVKDDSTKELFMGLILAFDGLTTALKIMPYRIERLHQKVDRIEKKIGSV
jgi:hypothetical protein